LSEDSQERLEKNPLRILDSKDRRDRAFVADAPKIDQFLSDDARAFFDAVTSGLDAAGVKWQRAESLVRGLDYYRHTAFEFIPDEGSEAAGRLGSQSTILGGGRYDGLMESLGGAPTPAVGWAAGIERLAMLVGERSEPFPTVVVVWEGKAEATHALAQRICANFRKAEVCAELVATGSPKKRFDKANKLQPQYFVLVSESNDPAMIADVRIKVRVFGDYEVAKRQIDPVVEAMAKMGQPKLVRADRNNWSGSVLPHNA
jgi:histidyl-tRNA synthetase